jgi:hypothetical protein
LIGKSKLKASAHTMGACFLVELTSRQMPLTEFKTRSLNFDFEANSLTLLQHDGRRWNVDAEFPFNSP